MIRLSDVAEIASVPGEGDDGHGNPTENWDLADWIREPVMIQPISSTEDNAAQQTVISRWLLVAYPGTVAKSTSRVRWPVGSKDYYTVEGEVALHRDIRSQPHHREAFLKRVEG